MYYPTKAYVSKKGNYWNLNVEENTFESTYKHCIQIQGFGRNSSEWDGTSEKATKTGNISIKNNNFKYFGNRVVVQQADNKDAAILKMNGDDKYAPTSKPGKNADREALVKSILDGKNTISDEIKNSGKHFLCDLDDTFVKLDGTFVE